jgi:hypothetical protein
MHDHVQRTGDASDRVHRATPTAPGRATAATGATASIAALQRTVGNAVVARMVTRTETPHEEALPEVPRSPGRPLAHELVHVVRQRSGPVAGTDSGHGYQVSDPGDRFEREAEAVATRAMTSARPELQRTADDDTATRTVQRAPDDGDTVEPAEAKAARAALTASLLGSPSLVQKVTRTVGRDLVVDRDVRAALLGRLDKGPLFSDGDLALIKRCDPGWLGEIGIGGYQDAVDYYDAANYKQWLDQEPGKRVLLATIAWDRASADGYGAESHKSPAYTLGRTLRLHNPEGLAPEEIAAFTDERDRQIRDAFVDTLVPQQPPEGEEDTQATAGKVDRARDILTRVFLILQNGLKVYREGKHVDYRDGDVARALAHGGRVNIRIPQLGDGDTPLDLLNWIGLTQEGKDVDPAERRDFSSHRMSIGKNKKGEPGTGRFEERGGSLTGARNAMVHELATRAKLRVENSRSYGVNYPAGGWGSKDFNSDVVTPDGGHGHLFLRFQPPDAKTDGSLQIGMETTAPHATTSPVGYKHTWRSTEKTRNPESSFYGDKRDKIGEGKQAVNQRMVLLQEFTTETSGWRDFLRYMEEYWNQQLAQASSDPAELRTLYEQLAGPREDRFRPPPAT